MSTNICTCILYINRNDPFLLQVRVQILVFKALVFGNNKLHKHTVEKLNAN